MVGLGLKFKLYTLQVALKPGSRGETSGTR